jgi:pimeloyl-CoA dehydrogenase
MNFTLNSEQRQLQDTLRRLLSDHYSFEKRRVISASAEGWSAAAWRKMCELGISALSIDEGRGGLGGNAEDIAVVMAELGRALVVEPFLPTAVLAACALGGADPDVAAGLLPRIAAGEVLLAWAHDERTARHRFDCVGAAAELRDGRWLLTGVKSNVLHAPAAEFFVVSARVRAPSNTEGVALFLVDARCPDLSCRPYRLVDESLAGEITLTSALAVPLADPLDHQRQEAMLGAVRRAGTAALCAEAFGVMQAAFELTAGYVNTRVQFGRPLAANQAVRHQIAEMAVALETCRSAVGMAAAAVDDPISGFQDISRAKLLIGLHGRTVCHQAIQLHGGIGVTEEYKVGHCLRRLVVLDQLFGDADAHAQELATQLVQATEVMRSQQRSNCDD